MIRTLRLPIVQTIVQTIGRKDSLIKTIVLWQLQSQDRRVYAKVKLRVYSKKDVSMFSKPLRLTYLKQMVQQQQKKVILLICPKTYLDLSMIKAKFVCSLSMQYAYYNLRTICTKSLVITKLWFNRLLNSTIHRLGCLSYSFIIIMEIQILI